MKNIRIGDNIEYIIYNKDYNEVSRINTTSEEIEPIAEAAKLEWLAPIDLWRAQDTA